MSDQPQGPGWWLASDGRYYPPQPPQPPVTPVAPYAPLAPQAAPAGGIRWGATPPPVPSAAQSFRYGGLSPLDQKAPTSLAALSVGLLSAVVVAALMVFVLPSTIIPTHTSSAWTGVAVLGVFGVAALLICMRSGDEEFERPWRPRSGSIMTKDLFSPGLRRAVASLTGGSAIAVALVSAARELAGL